MGLFSNSNSFEQRKQQKKQNLAQLNQHLILQNNGVSLVVIDTEQVDIVNQILPRLDMNYLHGFYVMGSDHDIDLSKLSQNRIEMKEQFILRLYIGFFAFFGSFTIVVLSVMFGRYLGFIGIIALVIVAVIAWASYVVYERRQVLGRVKIIDKNLGYYWEGDTSITNLNDIRQQQKTIILKDIILIQLAVTDFDDGNHHELNFVFSDDSRYNFLRFGNLGNAIGAMHSIAKLLNVNIVAKTELLS